MRSHISQHVPFEGPGSIGGWLQAQGAEKAFIRAYVDLDRPLLGICPGAKLIASSLGAAVYANQVKEIGWFPVAGSGEGTGFRFSERLGMFPRHGETSDLYRRGPGCSFIWRQRRSA